MCCDSPSPPDYSATAAASDYAADLGHELGTAQLEESRRQYDRTMEVAQPVVDAQLGIMEQTKEQAADYYEYGKKGRPVEDALNAESMVDVSGRDEAERADFAAKRGLITGGDQGVYDARRDDIEGSVGRATADARQGLTGEYNRMLRQGMRYGYSPQAMAKRFGGQATQAGLGVATAANTARRGGIDRARGLLGQDYNMQSGERNMRIQDDAMRWGKKLDEAGLYRGMPGASQGAYGVAVGAGSNAVQITMAPGNQLLGGMAAGADMQQTGAGQGLQGQLGILNARTSAYNTDASQPSTMGTLVGAGATLGAAYMTGGASLMASDRRLKEDIVLVGKDERTGLNLYEFNYAGGKQRYRGVMADEVKEVMPEAVTHWAGYAAVDYDMLGLKMVEVSHGR